MIHRPGDVQRIGHRRFLRLLALQPALGINPEVQFKLPVDAVDAFMVPAMSLDILHMQKA